MLRRFAILACVVGCGSTPEAPAPIALEHAQFDCRAAEPPPVRPEVAPGCFLDADCDRPLVVGHRGAGGNLALFAPENSLSAVRFAILVGADAVEIDVRHTSDDRLVVMHDGSLERTTGVDREVSDMTFDEVTAVPLLADGFRGEFGCERVPSFEALLALAKDRIDIDVDTKTGRADLVALAIRDAGMIEQASVSVSDPAKAVEARAAVPEIRVQVRPDDVDAYRAIEAMLDRPPEIIEIDEADLPAFRPIADAIGAKLFVNLFIRDLMAFGDGELSYYREPFDAGADIGQTEFAMWTLGALDRAYWDALPPARDVGIESPLLGE